MLGLCLILNFENQEAVVLIEDGRKLSFSSKMLEALSLQELDCSESD